MVRFKLTSVKEDFIMKQTMRQFIRYAAPSVVSLWVFSVYSLVDGMFVSWGVGPVAMAAVNIVVPFVNFLFAFAILFSVGASTLIAMELGRKKHEEANRIFSQNTVLIAAASIIIGVMGLLFSREIAIVLGAKGNTLKYAQQYLHYIMWFCPGFIVSYSLEVLTKTDGFPRLTILCTTASALCNCALDYLFVMVFHWGVPGAAIATGISQVFLAACYIIHFLKRKGRLSFVRFKPNLKVYRRIIPIGSADAIVELSNGAMVFMFNRAIMAISGERGVVIYTVAAYVNTIVLMTMTGISQGMQPLVSYNVGKGDSAACRRLFRCAIWSAAVLSVACFAAVQAFAPQISSLLIAKGDPDLINACAQALRLFSISFLFMGYNVACTGYLAASNRPAGSFAISISRGLALIAAGLAVLPLLLGETGVWLTPAAAEILCLGLTLSILFKKRRLSCKLIGKSA